MSSLSKANLALLALLLIHTLDHGLNQVSRTLPGSADLVGAAGFALIAASSLLALRRSPIAPVFSTGAGAVTAFGLIIVHLLPSWWSWVSDPYWDFNTNIVSWLSLLAFLGGAVYLTATGLRYQRYRHVRPIYRS